MHGLFTRSPTASDYDLEGTAALAASRARGIAVDSAHVDGILRNGVAILRPIDAAGPAFNVTGAGTIPFVECGAGVSPCASAFDFSYEVTRADLAQLEPITGRRLSGLLATKGHLTGPVDQPRAAGDATIAGLKAPDFEAVTLAGPYDVALPSSRCWETDARADLRATLPMVFGRPLQNAAGTISLSRERLAFDVRFDAAQGRTAGLKGTALLHGDRRELALSDLIVTLHAAPWTLSNTGTPPSVRWDDEGVSIDPLLFVSGSVGDQRIGFSGTWRADGRGVLHASATHVSLDAIEGALEGPARYGGTLDLEATIRGTRDNPIVTGQVLVTDGRIRRFAYQRLAGRVDYAADDFDIDSRLDQSPGVWINAVGKVPLALLDQELPERRLDVAVTSNSIGLGLIEGLTDAVWNVSGRMRFDVRAVGTSRDPHAQGTVEFADAAFLVTSTGSSYKNGRALLRLSPDRIDVDSVHLEDVSGRPLDLHGSLGTHELRVSDLQIDATARQFEVIRNEFGNVDIDATLQLRGRFETPRVEGDITINGGSLNVDEILQRTLLQPYATEPLALPSLDAATPLNPWNRSSLDVSLHIPKNLRLAGENLQVAADTPIGLGDIKLRVGGDLYLYKDPGSPLSVTGSLDAVSGTYSFQGRRFDIDEAKSSINFRGDLNRTSMSPSRARSPACRRASPSGDRCAIPSCTSPARRRSIPPTCCR